MGTIQDFLTVGGEMPKGERKPVYCAHPNKTSKEGNDAFIYECPLCGSHWISWDEEPKKEIGYVEAE